MVAVVAHQTTSKATQVALVVVHHQVAKVVAQVFLVRAITVALVHLAARVVAVVAVLVAQVRLAQTLLAVQAVRHQQTITQAQRFRIRVAAAVVELLRVALQERTQGTVALMSLVLVERLIVAVAVVVVLVQQTQVAMAVLVA